MKLQRARLDEVRDGNSDTSRRVSDPQVSTSTDIDQRKDSVQPTSAADYLLLGLELEHWRKLPEARDAVRESVELSPGESTGWLMLARVNAELGDYRSAIGGLDVCEAMLPGSTMPLFERGVIKQHDKQPAAAMEDFTACLKIDPTLNEARVNRALCLVELKRLPEAELTQVISCGRAKTRAYFLLAKVRQRMGNLAGAQSDIQTGLQRSPEDCEGWVERGLGQISTQPEKALDDFRQALLANPGSPRSLRNLAAVQALQSMSHLYSEVFQQPAEALIQLDRALELQPHDTLGLAGRGVLWARQGKVLEAVRDARHLETLEIDPITQYQVTCIYALCSQHDPTFRTNALETLASSLRRDPKVLEYVGIDPDIQSIKTSQGFDELVAAARTIRGLSPGMSRGIRGGRNRGRKPSDVPTKAQSKQGEVAVARPSRKPETASDP